MSWQQRITVDPNVLVGKPIVKGTRISVEFVIDLTPEDIQACLAYASEMLKTERVYVTPA